jgi:hypothetical protein
MYALATIEISDRLGFVVSELTPDETSRERVDAREKAALAASLLARELEAAVFGAA